jgi:hypothetical protein
VDAAGAGPVAQLDGSRIAANAASSSQRSVRRPIAPSNQLGSDTLSRRTARGARADAASVDRTADCVTLRRPRCRAAGSVAIHPGAGERSSPRS